MTEHEHIRENKQLETILVYPKNDVGNTGKYCGFEYCNISLICTKLIFILSLR